MLADLLGISDGRYLMLAIPLFMSYMFNTISIHEKTKTERRFMKIISYVFAILFGFCLCFVIMTPELKL